MGSDPYTRPRTSRIVIVFKFAAFARPEAPAFLVLFALDTLVRAMIMSAVPLQAYAVLGNAQQVSVL